MKQIRYYILLLFAIAAFTISYKNLSTATAKLDVDTLKKDSLRTNYIELQGKIYEIKDLEKEKAKGLEGAQVKVFKGDELQHIFFTDKKGKINFKLLLQNKYLLEISKSGYVTKRIELNAKINRVAIPKKKYKPYHEFYFDVDLFEDIKGLEIKALEKPVAKITYSYEKYVFEYDQSYTKKVNADLNKIYKEYYSLSKQQGDSILKSIRNKDSEKVQVNRKK